MSNELIGKYFTHKNIGDSNALNKIKAETGFSDEIEIFRGMIYDKDKVGSLIYKGIYNQKPVVLKIQFIKPEIEESEILAKFKAQNQSQIIRLPHVYTTSNWNEQDGFGYMIMEQVDGTKIYHEPFADADQMMEFCKMYTEYKTKCVNEPFFPKEKHEQSCLFFMTQRVAHWTSIARSKNHLSEADINNIDTFTILAAQHLPQMKMTFMHGHITSNDVLLENGAYVLMSNLFWSYRPEFYDTTFHLWSGIKAIKNQSVNLEEVKTYLQKWLVAYQTIPLIAADPNFETKFNMNMLERTIGALLVDLPNMSIKTAEDEQNQQYLMRLFQELFDYFADKLS